MENLFIYFISSLKNPSFFSNTKSLVKLTPLKSNIFFQGPDQKHSRTSSLLSTIALIQVLGLLL